jgi:hypothetical protein
MINKLCLSISIGFAAVSYAQQYSTSPFSSQGIGEAGGLEDAQFGGIGNCRTAVIDSNTVNLYNPASYSFLSKGQPLFAIGVSTRLSNYSTGDLSSNGRVSGLNQITMVLPLGKRFGMAAGLQPFSRKGYNIEQRSIISTAGDVDTMRYTYLGSGSTQQVVGGLSYKLLNLPRHQLAIGANYSYIFGSVTNERRSELMGYDPEGGVDLTTYRVHGAHYSTGLTYNIMLDTMGNRYLRLGATFSPEQQISAHRDYYLYFSDDVGNPNNYQTLDSTVDDKGHIVYPASMSFGFNFQFRPVVDESYNLKNVYQINVYGDYTKTLWSNYGTSFGEEHIADAFKDANRFALGLQFTPNYESHAKRLGSSYFSRIRYRAGGYYGLLPNLENGEQLTESGFTIGFGLPIANQRTNSSFNFSIQYGQRGSTQPDALKEQFVGINFGVILAPSAYDTWFRKHKLD